jgi:hypothetical protein
MNSRDVLAQELSAKEASYQVLISDMEARPDSAGAGSGAIPLSLPGHHQAFPESKADTMSTAHLENELRSVQTRAESALSVMFSRLARDRAAHDREKQQLQHKLLDMSQELFHRRALDQKRMAQASRVRELWHDVMSAVDPEGLGAGGAEPEASSQTSESPPSKVAAALIQLQGPLLDLLGDVSSGGTPTVLLPQNRLATEGQSTSTTRPGRLAGARASLPAAMQQGALEWALPSEDDGLSGLRQRLAQLRRTIRGDAEVSDSAHAGAAASVVGSDWPPWSSSCRRPVTWGSADGAEARGEGFAQPAATAQEAGAAKRVPGNAVGGAGVREGDAEDRGGEARETSSNDIAAMALLQSWGSFGRVWGDVSAGAAPAPQVFGRLLIASSTG